MPFVHLYFINAKNTELTNAYMALWYVSTVNCYKSFNYPWKISYFLKKKKEKKKHAEVSRNLV